MDNWQRSPVLLSAARLAKHVLEVQDHTHRTQAVHHGTAAPDPIGAAMLEEGLDQRAVGREEVPQDVHLAPGCRNGELTPADNPHSVPGPRRDCRRNPVERVVIGQRNRREAGSLRARNDAFRSELAVRRGRVQVEIDRPAGNWFCGQALYPVSGAVQPGWDRFHNSFN